MKFRFLFKIAIPVICLSVGLSARVNYQEMFLKANKFYKEGEFQSAYDLYKKIEIKSSQLHYNKGNCAYQLGKYGYALLYWRRAERSWGLFNRAELLDNIALLKHKINKSKPYKNITLLFLKKMKRYVSSLLRSTSLFSFQLLFLIFWVFLFLYLRYLYKNKQKIIIAILFFLIALFGTLLVIKYSLSCYQRGVVIKNNVSLLSGAGKTFQKLGELNLASEVTIKESSGKFYKITFANQVGWVKNSDIEKV